MQRRLSPLDARLRFLNTATQNVPQETCQRWARWWKKASVCHLSGLLQVVVIGGDCCEDRNHRQLDVSARESLRGLLQALRYQPICHLQRKTMTGLHGKLAIWLHWRVLSTLPCSRAWSKDGPGCRVRRAAALYTGASRAASQEPTSAPSSPFPA